MAFTYFQAHGYNFGSIPPQIQRIWIYEDNAEGTTVMVVLDQNTLPVHLYFITNPLYADVMESQYKFPKSLPIEYFIDSIIISCESGNCEDAILTGG
jgi:hypothetical protein